MDTYICSSSHRQLHSLLSILLSPYMATILIAQKETFKKESYKKTGL